MLRRRNRQRGQVVVLFAAGSIALVAMVGLVLMAGLLFWDQRELQTLADGAALAGAQGITNQSCSVNLSTPITLADEFVAQQLGTASTALSISGACSTFYLGSSSYPCPSNTTCNVTYKYPWNSKPWEVMVSVSRPGVPLQFGAFIGTSTATVGGRAVAQHSFATPPTSFALFAQNGVNCQGSGVHSPSPKIVVNGSIYSAGLVTPTGNCAIYARDTLAFDGTEDYGDILVYPDGEAWYNSGGSCGVPSGAAGNTVCSDGFELGGHTTMTCGNNAGTSPQTEYISGAQANNPDPCSGVPEPVAQLNEANYQGTDPNSDAAIYGSNGGRCTTTAGTSPGNGSAALLTSNNKNYGWGPAPHGITNGVEHFAPGCYGYLDVGTFLKEQSGVTSAQLDPGFYLFNGYDCNSDNQSGCTASTGGGLCLNASGSQSVILTGTDITLEFVNSTSFSSASCSKGPTSACGGSACDFGTSITAPTSLAASAATTGGTLPAGTYSFEATYADAVGETTASSALGATVSSGTTGKVSLSVSTTPVEATSAKFYLVSCSGANFPSGTCASGGVNPGYLGTGTISSSAASLSFTSPTQGNYVQPPSTNTASIWFAAPPNSPEPAPAAPTLSAASGVESNLPAGTYQVELTYRTPEGETTASPASSVVLTAGQDIQVSTGAAAQGVSLVGVYLAGYTGAGTVSTGYLEQVAAPVGSTLTFTLSSATQGTGAAPPTSNTTSSSWCSQSKAGWTATDAAICANRLIWAPSSTWAGGEIAGTFYVKGANENSAIMGNIYWPGPANSTSSSNAAGCNYDANGVGGLLGQVICDSVFVQGGSVAGTATIGWTTGATYSSPPQIDLVE